jgi:molybdopterin/thiamine biosynthesis adenylyltransferase
MGDAELLRYSRHILLDEIGIAGQTLIVRARALVIGAGGLGSPVAMYLAAAGVGRITLVDPDIVDLTNLQRQIAHQTDSIGKPKVDSAAVTLHQLNPQVKVSPLKASADSSLLEQLVPEADVVLDCSDNFSTRQAVNAACVHHNKPLVSGAAIRFDGQISVYDPRSGQQPCYACVFPPDVALEEARCATMGVFTPLVGIVGAMQAAEALKLLCGIGTTLAGRLLMFDARSTEWTELRLSRNRACPVCSRQKL